MAATVPMIEVPNPYWTPASPRAVPAKLKVERALRDDQLARLHHRRHIGEAMYRAGRHWQRLYAEAAIGRIGSSGDLKEPVDGTRRIADMITDRQQHAMKQLARLSRALGIEGDSFIHDLLADNLSYRQIIRRRRGAGGIGYTEENLGRRMRECLDTLAKQLGYCT